MMGDYGVGLHEVFSEAEQFPIKAYFLLGCYLKGGSCLVNNIEIVGVVGKMHKQSIVYSGNGVHVRPNLNQNIQFDFIYNRNNQHKYHYGLVRL